jgi:3-phenylpropionate/cinnamic acid dioxygenase small subunit
MTSDSATAEFERLERECTRILYREAEMLDRGNLQEWFEFLAPDIEYRVPVRTTRRKRDGEGFSETAFFYDDDHSSLALRVARFVTDYAWSESPPGRTRRNVTNIRVTGINADEAAVTSNLALFSFRGEVTVPTILTGERQDIVRLYPEGWKLKSRLVLLDTTIVGIDSLAIFF